MKSDFVKKGRNTLPTAHTASLKTCSETLDMKAHMSEP